MISLLQLQYFRELAKGDSLSKTAQNLYVSQSTLSASISKMEKELGVQLFNREQNRMYLNEYGTLYLKYIDTALSNIARGEESVRKMHQKRKNLILLTASHSSLWKDMALHFMEQNFPVQVQFKREHLETCQQHLENGSLDFAITGTGDLTSERLESSVICTLRLCLITPPGHPFSLQESVSLKDLEGQPYVDLAEGLSFRQYCDQILEESGVQVNHVFEYEAEARPAIIMGGAGFGITPDHEMMKRPYLGCSFVPIRDENLSRSISLYWLKGREFTPAMERFRQAVLTWIV